ncbi:hypothetical protein AO715_03935 [Xanthomonas sp. Mitacek01]|nr:hypothetical protein AO715_03935 [Xanthomonas sp. Mitacek01]
MRFSLTVVGLLLCLVVPALAKPPAETAFDEWLDAFNRNERAALTEFNTRRFGEPEHNIEYLLDSRVKLTVPSSLSLASVNGARFTYRAIGS